MRRNNALIMWIGVNVILIAKYLWDSISIQCEPCLPGIECPPCQTNFMEFFWWYLILWNSGMFLVRLIMIKKNKLKNEC